MMSHRTRPPLRRPNVTRKTEFRGQTYFLTFGLHPDTGQVCEVFGNAKKTSSDLDFLVADACVALSLALQSGVTAENLLRTMHFEPVYGRSDVTRAPASLIGHICAEIIEEEGLSD